MLKKLDAQIRHDTLADEGKHVRADEIEYALRGKNYYQDERDVIQKGSIGLAKNRIYQELE